MALKDKGITVGNLDYFNKHVMMPHQSSITMTARALELLQQWAQSELAQLGSNVSSVDTKIGDLSTLNTNAKDTAVNAINELKYDLEGLGEPFRVKQWAGTNLNVEIPYCTEDIANLSIAKMVFKTTGQEATDFQIVGMISYEVKDSSGQRMNCWPVCQFTGQNQTELSVRWMCGGTTRKTATSINAWVLLKHR